MQLFLKKFIYFYFCLCWVFVSVRGLSPVVASWGHSSSRCAGLSLSRPLLLRSTGSRRAGSVVVAHRPSCSAACGIFPDQGLNPCPLHWQADSQPLRHQRSPGAALRSSRPASREPKQRLPTRGSCCGRSGPALPLGPGIILTADYVPCSSSSWQESIEWCILTSARYRGIFPNKQKPLRRVSHRFQVRVITKVSTAEQNKLVKSSAKKAWILWNSQEVEKASRVMQFKVVQQPGNLRPSVISWVHVRSYR